MKEINCYICRSKVERDFVALNKKLISRQVNKFMCATCLADFFCCTEEDLLVKIEEFKEQGCGLFVNR